MLTQNVTQSGRVEIRTNCGALAVSLPDRKLRLHDKRFFSTCRYFPCNDAMVRWKKVGSTNNCGVVKRIDYGWSIGKREWAIRSVTKSSFHRCGSAQEFEITAEASIWEYALHTGSIYRHRWDGNDLKGGSHSMRFFTILSASDSAIASRQGLTKER